MDAKGACDKLNGFNFQNRYLVVLYHQPGKGSKGSVSGGGGVGGGVSAGNGSELAERQVELERKKQEFGIE